MKLILSLTLISTALFLFGCASNQTIANQRAESLNARLEENRAIIQSCFKKIEDTSEAIYVRKNIVLANSDADNKFELLGSTAKLNEEGKKVLLRRLAQTYECNKPGLIALSSIYTPYANAMSASMQRNDVIYAKLLNGTMSIGEANQALLASRTQYAKEWDDARTIRNNQIAQAHNAELQDRNAKTMILQNMLNSMTTPSSSSITTCNPVGGSISCITR
jgi:hypothetical protein